MDPASIAIINSINSLKTFKDTLNDSMTFLDKTSESTTSDSSSGSGVSLPICLDFKCYLILNI